MKVLINKYESGGSALPFVDFTPLTGAAPATSAGVSSGASSSDDSVGLKDLLNLTNKLEGLPVDSSMIVSSIKKMYNDANVFSNGQISTDDLVTTYLSTIQKIKVAKYNNDLFKFVQSTVNANGGTNEVAINSDGKLLVQNTQNGKITPLTVSQFRKLQKQAPDQFEALTNDNLLFYRAEHPDFAFNNNILDTVSNGIGSKKVTELLLQVASGIGKDSLQQEGYSEKTADKITAGMGVLKSAYEQGMTVEGLYKQGYLNEDQQAQTIAALKYLWAALPTNAKTYLEYKSESDNPEEGALALMSNLLFAKNSSVLHYTQDLVKNPNGGNSDGSSSSSDAAKLDPVKALVLGMGYQKEFNINPGSSYGATLIGNYSVLTNHSGQPLGEFSTLKDVSEGAYAPSLDLSNATIGGARISTLDKAFLNNADVIGVDLPIDINYYNQTGITRPDINLLNKVEQLHTEFKQGIIDKNDMNAVNAECERLGLPTMYANMDENGIPQLNKNYFARFARIDGLVDETALDEGSPVDSTVKNADRNKREGFKSYMKTHDKNYTISEGFLGMGQDNLYEGAIYIPIRDDIIAASLGGSNYYKLPGANDAIKVAQKWADMKAVQNYQAAPTLSQLQG